MLHCFHCSSYKPRWSLTFSWLIYRLYNHSVCHRLSVIYQNRPSCFRIIASVVQPSNRCFSVTRVLRKKESEEILKMPLFCSMKGPERGHQARTTVPHASTNHQHRFIKFNDRDQTESQHTDSLTTLLYPSKSHTQTQS